METGVKRGLNEDDDTSRRVHEVHNSVTGWRVVVDDLSRVEIDADDDTW